MSFQKIEQTFFVLGWICSDEFRYAVDDLIERRWYV